MLRKLKKVPSPSSTFATIVYYHSISSHLVPFLTSNHSQNSVTENLETTYSRMLQNCVETSNLPFGNAIHSQLIKKSLNSLYLNNHLVNMYVKCGNILSGTQLFDEMPLRNVVSWTALIAGFVQMGSAFEALDHFSRMHRTGMKPNEFTFVSALQACSLCGVISCAYELYSLIVRFGFESNIFLVNAMLTCLIKDCKLDEALVVFDGCLYKDVVSWNTMMTGYLEFAYWKVPGFLFRMLREGVRPDNYTFSSVLTGLAELKDLNVGVQVHALLVKAGNGSEICVGNSLVDMYLKNQKLQDGFEAFQEIPAKDVQSWTQMAIGCLNYGEPNKALGVVGEMRRMGVEPNKFTLATAINACANLASLEEGQKIHGLRIKLGDDVDVCVDNALLDMYAKCGFMDGAMVVFKSMDQRSVVSWTTMIIGYAQNGKARKALEVFDEMRLEGVEPNEITFVCVLYACSQGGFVDEASKYFSSMVCDHGIVLRQDHYACMVNILGRAGCIKEAEELILGMPFQPGALIWQTLLAACQLHGDVESAKHAAEKAIVLDEGDPSTYVSLSNMLASSSNWDGVGTLRELMESRDVQKTPGSSWIHINGDPSRPKAHGDFETKAT